MKHYLKNVRFITGTAYAGKSTMCKLLSDNYNLHHCEENYNSETIFNIVDVANQPNLNYFNLKKDWQEFLNRSPEEYEDWIFGNNEELTGFEITELIRLSQDKMVIVDTNIPLSTLKEITEHHQVAVMVSPQSMSVDRFFDRDDPEKMFLLDQIMNGPTPEKTMENFRACIARVNSQFYYDEFVNSGYYVLKRDDSDKDTRTETMKELAIHFKLEGEV